MTVQHPYVTELEREGFTITAAPFNPAQLAEIDSRIVMAILAERERSPWRRPLRRLREHLRMPL